jgi:hypothetical protein
MDNPMKNEEREQTIFSRTKFSTGRLMVSGIVLILVFLAGWVPGYMKGQRQDKELREARHENHRAELRDLASLAYLQATQRDFGLAAATSTRLFDRIGEVARETTEPGAKRAIEGLLSLRDPVTAKLATGEADVLTELQNLVVRTREATQASTVAGRT